MSHASIGDQTRARTMVYLGLDIPVYEVLVS